MRRLPLAAAATALSLCFIATGTQLGAYATTGHKWGTTSVLYYVNPDNLYVSAADAISSVQSAANAWNSQGGVDLKLVYAGTTNRSAAQSVSMGIFILCSPLIEVPRDAPAPRPR